MIRSISYKIRRNKFRYSRFKYINFLRSRTGVIIILIGFIILIGVIMLFPHFIRNTYKVTVTNKLIMQHNNTDEYFIYTQTEDGTIKVFRNANNFLELKFNSKDLFWAMEINRRYEVTAYGFNIPMLSDYQNIVKVKGL